jgi:hypothetical protein
MYPVPLPSADKLPSIAILRKYPVPRASAHLASSPWPKLPRTSIVFPVQHLAVSGYTTTSRVPRLGFPGGHAHGASVSWLYLLLVPLPRPPLLPLPLSASMSGHVDRSPKTPPWAVLAREVLLCSMVLTSGSILVPKHGLLQLLDRPHGRAALSNE